MRWGKGKEQPETPAAGWSVVSEPLAGTEVAVGAIDDGGDGGATPLAAVDPAFNADAFVEWSSTVYGRAIAAWQRRDPEPLRPVMDAAVWNSYAQHLLTVSALPLAQSLMGSARGTPRLAGATAASGYHSALVAFDVVADPAVFAKWGLSAPDHGWSERWLFQRPGSCRTNASGAVAVCPVCGAPAQPEETGQCRYCHADITTRTAGWLVTRTATTMASLARMDEGMARLRDKAAATLPPMSAPAVGTPMQPPRAGTPMQPPRADT